MKPVSDRYYRMLDEQRLSEIALRQRVASAVNAAYVRPSSVEDARARYRALNEEVQFIQFRLRELKGSATGVEGREKRGPEKEAERQSLGFDRRCMVEEMMRLKQFVLSHLPRAVKEHPFSLLLRIKDAIMSGEIQQAGPGAALLASINDLVPMEKRIQWDAGSKKPWKVTKRGDVMASEDDGCEDDGCEGED